MSSLQSLQGTLYIGLTFLNRIERNLKIIAPSYPLVKSIKELLNLPYTSYVCFSASLYFSLGLYRSY